jgi:hypothetical protein
MSEPMSARDLALNLDELPPHHQGLPVLVRTQDGRSVWLTVQLTDVRREGGYVVLVGDLQEVD